jgi:excisionase family DNA binding protein
VLRYVLALKENIMDEILTLKEVAEFLKLGKLAVWKLAQEGTLPFFRVGSSYRMKKSDLLAFIKNGETDTQKKK